MRARFARESDVACLTYFWFQGARMAASALFSERMNYSKLASTTSRFIW
jgi:hypothetical protein